MASSSGQDEGGKVNWQWSGDDMKIDQSKGPKLSELKSSRAYSVATPAADKSRREPLKANNPGSIPTAGGRALGQGAREDRERRKSRMSSDMGMPPLDKEGSPDPSTQNNTQANTIPQRMAEENGEGSSKIEERPESSPAAAAAAPGVQVTNADGVTDEPKGDGLKTDMFQTDKTEATDEVKANDVEEKKDTVGEIASTPAKQENAAPPAKERRGSRLDDVLGKLKLGGSKKK